MVKRLTEFEKLLSGSLSRKVVDDIVESVLFHEEDFPSLFRLIWNADDKISWRATWACEKLAERCPEWFMDKRTDIIKYALVIDHSGKKRLLLSILCRLPLEDAINVDFLNACMEWMFSPKEAIAVQASSILLAYRMCLHEPELLPELRLYLENAQTEYLPAAVRTKIRNTLKEMNKREKASIKNRRR